MKELIHKKSVRAFAHKPTESNIRNRRDFNLVMSTYTSKEAILEASRCMMCDEICNVCVSVCPNLANFSYHIKPINYQLQKAVIIDNNKIQIENDELFTVKQPHQVLNIRDLCNECGNCTTFCPTSGKPFIDKPGLCLSVQTLNKEGKGYLLSRLPDRLVLIYKSENMIKTLTFKDGTYIYETDQVKASIDPLTFNLIDVTFLTPCVKEFHFGFAAEMSIVLQGAIQLNF